MFCPKCGKEIKEEDNFCRFCGTYLKEDVSEICQVENLSDDEEIVLYDVQKHWRSLALSILLIPLFFFYFWNIFLNTHSFFSWIVVLAILWLIIYPVARYKSDNIIITNKFAHIKIGIINPEEKDIPLKDLNILEVSQSSMGRLLDYGQAALISNSERIEYGYIKSPEDLQYIIENPDEFVQEYSKQEVSI